MAFTEYEPSLYPVESSASLPTPTGSVVNKLPGRLLRLWSLPSLRHGLVEWLPDRCFTRKSQLFQASLSHRRKGYSKP